MNHFRFLLIFLILGIHTNAQKSEGYIRFSMQYAESGLSKEELEMLPAESEIWFKGDKMKMLLPMGMGMQSSVLVQQDEVHLLMDLMGNRMAIKTSKAEMQRESKNAKKFSLNKLTDEKKEIAGYECTKAILSAPGEEDMQVWFTDKIKSGGSWYYNLEGINGFPLEFSFKTKELSARMIAREIKIEQVSDQLFVVPDGYKIMTQDEMMKSLGGSR